MNKLTCGYAPTTTHDTPGKPDWHRHTFFTLERIAVWRRRCQWFAWIWLDNFRGMRRIGVDVIVRTEAGVHAQALVDDLHGIRHHSPDHYGCFFYT